MSTLKTELTTTLSAMLLHPPLEIPNENSCILSAKKLSVSFEELGPEERENYTTTVVCSDLIKPPPKASEE